jgi:hypothetical protein
MHQFRSPLFWVLAGFLLVGSAALALGQGFDPSMFGLPPRLGSGDAMSTRDLGMGAISSCLDDVQYPNPALAGFHRTTDAGVREMGTVFEQGPSMDSTMLHFERPLHVGTDGFQVTALEMSTSNQGGLSVPELGPVNTDMTDKEIVVDYGRRVGRRTAVGLSVLGGEQSDLSMNAVEGPMLLNLKANAGFGFRIGAVQEWGPGDYAGVLYSNSQNNVSAIVNEVASRPVYHGDELNVGAAHHIMKNVVAAVEFERGTTSRGAYLGATDLWHFGAEYAPNAQWAVRAGAQGGQPTAGVGYAGRHWHADYAFIQNLNDNDFHALFGSSETHAVHLTYLW